MLKRGLFLILLGVIALVMLSSCSCEGEKATFKVKFESYVDTAKIPTQEVMLGGLATVPDVKMERAGYTFKGWYLGEKKWDFENDTVTKDMVLVAKWNLQLSYKEADDGTLWVVGCDFDVTDVVIPDTYNGKKVTGIHWGFTGRKNLKSVVIPSTVVYISDYAFNNTAIEEIIIPESVTEIGEAAFSACKELRNIYCEASSASEGWHEYFNKTFAKVSFGYKSEK